MSEIASIEIKIPAREFLDRLWKSHCAHGCLAGIGMEVVDDYKLTRVEIADNLHGPLQVLVRLAPYKKKTNPNVEVPE